MFFISQYLGSCWAEDGSISYEYGPYSDREECMKAVKSLETDWRSCNPDAEGEYWYSFNLSISEITPDTPPGLIKWEMVGGFSRETDPKLEDSDSPSKP